jgi:hypothetical protein
VRAQADLTVRSRCWQRCCHVARFGERRSHRVDGRAAEGSAAMRATPRPRARVLVAPDREHSQRVAMVRDVRNQRHSEPTNPSAATDPQCGSAAVTAHAPWNRGARGSRTPLVGGQQALLPWRPGVTVHSRRDVTQRAGRRQPMLRPRRRRPAPRVMPHGPWRAADRCRSCGTSRWR